MKKILSLLTFMLVIATGYAQSFHKNQINIFAGVGMPPLSNSHISRTIYTPPIFAGAEYAFAKRFSIGLLAGYQNYKTTFSGLHSVDSSQNAMLAIGVRGAWHFVRKNKIDAYAGVGLFGVLQNGKSNEQTYNENVILPGIFTGIRYRFVPQFAAFAELGLSFPAIAAGLDMRL